MDTSPTAAAGKSTLLQDWLAFLRYWLGGRRALIALAAATVLAAAALNWSWLVAVGIAPLLVAIAPCAAMCALGLCMNKMVGRSCSTHSESTAASEAVPKSVEATPANAPSTATLPAQRAGEVELPALSSQEGVLPESAAGAAYPRHEIDLTRRHAIAEDERSDPPHSTDG